MVERKGVVRLGTQRRSLSATVKPKAPSLTREKWRATEIRRHKEHTRFREDRGGKGGKVWGGEEKEDVRRKRWKRRRRRRRRDRWRMRKTIGRWK